MPKNTETPRGVFAALLHDKRQTLGQPIPVKVLAGNAVSTQPGMTAALQRSKMEASQTGSQKEKVPLTRLTQFMPKPIAGFPAALPVISSGKTELVQKSTRAVSIGSQTGSSAPKKSNSRAVSNMSAIVQNVGQMTVLLQNTIIGSDVTEKAAPRIRHTQPVGVSKTEEPGSASLKLDGILNFQRNSVPSKQAVAGKIRPGNSIITPSAQTSPTRSSQSHQQQDTGRSISYKTPEVNRNIASQRPVSVMSERSRLQAVQVSSGSGSEPILNAPITETMGKVSTSYAPAKLLGTETPKIVQPDQPGDLPTRGVIHNNIASGALRTPVDEQTFIPKVSPTAPQVANQPEQQIRQQPQQPGTELHVEKPPFMAGGDKIEVRTEQPKGQPPALSQEAGGSKGSQSGGPGNGSSASPAQAGGILYPGTNVKQHQRTAAEEKAGSESKGSNAGSKTNNRARNNTNLSSDTLRSLHRSDPNLGITKEAIPRIQPELGEKIQEIQNLKGIVDRIRARAQLVNNRGNMTLEARLHPAHLGPVKVQVEMTGDQMRLSFTADRPEAVAALQNAQSDLSNLMSDHGYQLIGCDIDQRSPQQSRWQEAQNTSNLNRGSFDQDAERAAQQPLEEEQPKQHRQIDLGYNTLDLVA